MHSRPLLFALLGGLVAVGAGFVACSSNSPGFGDGGVGMDSNTAPQPEAGKTVFETSTGDVSHLIVPDGGTTGSGDVHAQNHDTGGIRPVGDAGDAHAIDAALAACTLVTGACDLVSQNCSSGSECTLVEELDGSVGTACEPTQASEHLAKGTPCCPPPDNSNPCDPGLVCIGNACVDGGSPGPGLPPGWGGSRCSPTCCPNDAGDTSNCGTAGDGGPQGHCDLGISLVTNGPSEYYICTYPETCEPLHGHECLNGYGCEVENMAGTSSCFLIYNPNGDAGATSGQPCMYANQCADGLVCIGATADTSTCLWMCLLPGEATPFDAGALNSMPGHGGCPSPQTCNTQITGFPTWLGVCGT
jgi:hypothetical protein